MKHDHPPATFFPAAFTQPSMRVAAIFRTVVSSLFAAICIAEPLRAAAVQETDPWRAQWIGTTTQMLGPSRLIAFRRQIDLPADPARAVARIGAADRYWLWINGTIVVVDGQLKRGPTPEDGYYDVVDLTPHLRRGRNTIAAAVWYWGWSGYSHRSSGLPGFLFDADIDAQPLVSDSTWRALELPGYEAFMDSLTTGILPERNVRMNGREEIVGWREPEFDDRGWSTPLEFGRPPVRPWNRLYARPIPLWKDYGLRDYAQLRGPPSGSEGGTIRAVLPYNAQVHPYLKVEAAPGLVIDVRTDTYVVSGQGTVRTEYITRAGVQEYESLAWMSGHEVRYTIPAGVRVLELKFRETGYDADFAGGFASDDPLLDELWLKARRTLYVGMRDHHMDCPDRERAQWYGDVVNQQGQVFYALDAAHGPLLARKGWSQLAAWRKESGTLKSVIPHGTGNASSELPLQMLNSAGWYGVWLYYRYTGDAALVREFYPAARDYLHLWTMGTNGLVVHRPGDIPWPDHGDNADYPVLENAWYYLALKAAAKMAELVGATTDVPAYSARMESIRSSFHREFWRGDHFRSSTHTGAIDDRANAMAVLAGLANEADYPAMLRVLQREEHASPYMEKYVLEAMILMGAPAAALERMKRRYLPQIESSLSTLWELFECCQWGGYNHAWAGGPLTLLSEYVAGIAPAGAGYDGYTLKPRLGSLQRVSAVVPTPRGPIRVRHTRDSTSFNTSVEAAGLSGTVEIPLAGLERPLIRVNGTEVWRDGAPAGAVAGVRLESVDDQSARLSVRAGSWNIRASSDPADPPPPPTVPDEVFNLSENPIRSGRAVFHFARRPSLASVFTLDGRRVADLTLRLTSDLRAEWDVTNDRGEPIAPGVYLFVARIGDRVVRRRLFVTYDR